MYFSALYYTIYVVQVLIVNAQDDSDNDVDRLKAKKESEDDFNRYFKEESYKPAIFGSSAYNPVKESFEPLKRQKHQLSPEIKCINTTGSTIHDDVDDMMSSKHGSERGRNYLFRYGTSPANSSSDFTPAVSKMKTLIETVTSVTMKKFIQVK